MNKYNSNLRNFAVKQKKFLFIQFLIILILTVVFAVPNFKQSHYYKLIFLNDSRAQLLYGYEPSLVSNYNRMIDSLPDPIAYLDPKLAEDVPFFGALEHEDKTKFLDSGYSDLKNFFYVKLSRIDLDIYKLELVVENEEFDVADYQVRYNQAIREYYILQHNVFKAMLDSIERYTVDRDKNYLFDDFRFAYALKREAIKKRALTENIVIIERESTSLFKSKCGSSKLADVTQIYYLKWFHDCLMRKDAYAQTEKTKIIGYFKTQNETFDIFYFLNKEAIEKQIEDTINIHKKMISSKVQSIRKKINDRIEITKKQNFIDFEYLNSNYSNKNKTIELVKFFLLFSFLFFILNIIFYFFSIRKLKNG